MAYTDADEDAERLISFADGGSKDKDEEWVETHAGRSLCFCYCRWIEWLTFLCLAASVDLAANPGNIDDIPDLDGPSSLSGNLESLSLGSDKPVGEVSADVPDMADIPDMEEEGLEGDEDEATAKPTVISLAYVNLPLLNNHLPQ